MEQMASLPHHFPANQSVMGNFITLMPILQLITSTIPQRLGQKITQKAGRENCAAG